MAAETRPGPEAYRLRMRFRVLGPLVAVPSGDAGAEREGEGYLGGPKQRAVLAMLIAGAGEMVSVDVIADGVWGEDLPSSVSASIHSYVSHLRAAFGGGIERVGSGYRLQAQPGDIDAVAFEQMVTDARRLLATDAGPGR